MNEYRFAEIELGLEASFSRTITSEMMTQFLALSGDCNPLHIDSSYAQEKGFEDRVVYGLLSSTFYSTLVGVYLPGKYCILQGIDIQFSKPVFVGDQLSIQGKVSYINEAYQQVEIKAFITNQAGIKVSKAKIKVGVIDD